MSMWEMLAVDLDGTSVFAVVSAISIGFVFKHAIEMTQIIARITNIAWSQSIDNRSFAFVVMNLGENISDDCIRRDQLDEILTNRPRERQHKQGAHQRWNFSNIT